tara:strand:+ start:260 stop:469 length:210 start_codon:yes stop_codon:yes gene_type:complete
LIANKSVVLIIRRDLFSITAFLIWNEAFFLMSDATFNIDFIGIGSGKCGSTWIYENIVRHPEVCDKNLK